jgi:hypothetical protein
VSSQSIVAQVTDSVGIGVPGATVTWIVVSGGASLLPDTTIADSHGTVGTSLRLPDLPGPVLVRGMVGTGISQDFDIKVVPGPLYRLTPLYTDLTLRVAMPFSATVKAIDLYGNGIPGIVLTSRAGDVQYTNLTTQPALPLAQVTDANGDATFRGTVGSLPGIQSFRIDGPVATQFPTTFTVWFRVHAMGDHGYIAPSSGQAMTLTLTTGATVDIDAVVIQSDGDPAAQTPVAFTLAPGNGSIVNSSGAATSSSLARTDNTGLAGVKWQVPATAGTYTISATTPPPNDGGGPLVITAVVH